MMAKSVHLRTVAYQKISLYDLCWNKKCLQPRRRTKKSGATGKTAWTQTQKLAFIDSLFRGSEFAPHEPIMLQQLKPTNRYRYKVLDGWSRIEALREFLNCKLRFPYSLRDMPEYKDYAYKRWY